MSFKPLVHDPGNTADALARAITEEKAELIRRCLAEVGYVDGVDGFLEVESYGADCFGIWWKSPKTSERSPSDEMLWRARELAELEHAVCLSHFERWDTEACSVDRRLVRDCGA